MVYLINKATQIAMVLLMVLVVVAALVFVNYFMAKKKRAKRRIDEEDMVKVSFDKKDTREYIKHIEDIRDDMIITDGGTRFVAALKCTGFDFFYETAERQLSTVSGMYAFSNTITKPVSYRQYSRPVDLEYTLKRHQRALDERNEELFHVHEDIRDMEANLKRDRSVLSDADARLYESEIEKAKKKEKALKFRCFHLQDEIRAISRYTGSRVDPETVETWIFEWKYDPYDFSYDMKPEDIYYRAIKELHSIGQTKIHALMNCGVRAKRCTTEDLIEMCRWYSYPVSAERYKLSDIKDSSFFDDITASDPYAEARKKAIKEIKEEAEMALLQSLKNEREMQKAVDKGGARKAGEKKTTEQTNAAPTALKSGGEQTGDKKPETKQPINKTSLQTGSVSAQASNRIISGRRPLYVRSVNADIKPENKSAISGTVDLIGED